MRSPSQLRELRSQIGMIFQTFNLVKRTSVLNNVLMGRLHATSTWRSLIGWYKPADVEIAMQALERVDIVEKAYVRGSNLSGGQQQRVGIARALAQEPKMMLADEPVASLDPPTSHVVMRDLQRINRELGITMIVNLHFLDLAKVYGERIIGLRAGELVYDGTPPARDENVFRDIYGRSLTADDVLEAKIAGTATTALSSTTRPAKPTSSPFMLLGFLAFLVLTYLALSKQFGIGLDVRELIDDFGRVAHVLWRDNPNPAKNGALRAQLGLYRPDDRADDRDVPDGSYRRSHRLRRGPAHLVSRLARDDRRPVDAFLTRSILNVVRAIPDILYALVFVAAVGIGPLPGILALILFNVGIVAKLLSETIDGVDPGPIEAARASGGNQIQNARSAVLPQVLPNYVAYSLYTFELNIRAATVVGLVGAGGIGRELFAQYKLFNWSNVAVIIVELFVLVFVIETVSIWLRRRLV